MLGELVVLGTPVGRKASAVTPGSLSGPASALMLANGACGESRTDGEHVRLPVPEERGETPGTRLSGGTRHHACVFLTAQPSATSRLSSGGRAGWVRFWFEPQLGSTPSALLQVPSHPLLRVLSVERSLPSGSLHRLKVTDLFRGMELCFNLAFALVLWALFPTSLPWRLVSTL